MSLAIKTGNIFTSKSQTLVNTINCEGVMGAGLALECRLRYPEMYDKYVHLCEEGQIKIGTLWIYKSTDRWILNFPTKNKWRFPSKIEYLQAGLEKFLSTYKDKSIASIAFPLLGADKGGIPQESSLQIMTAYLKQADLEVEIFKYDANAKDDLYDKIKAWILEQDVEYLTEKTKIGKAQIKALISAIHDNSEIVQLNQLAAVKGIGIKTLEKVFAISRTDVGNNRNLVTEQMNLL